MENNGYLAVKNDRIVDGAGDVIVLRGYNIGGWMNMENFLTGYPGTESQQRAALLKALGKERYDLFFDTFMNAFLGEGDIAYMASLGFNSLRIPFNYHHFESDEKPFELKSAGFKLLDRAVDLCAKYGIYAILDMHAVPGWQNQHWHCDNPTNWANFWNHPHFQDRAIHLWKALADHYRDNTWIGGYNIMNEPGDSSGKKIKPYYDRVVTAIREIDQNHMILLDGNKYARDFTPFEGFDVYENTIYSAHDYKFAGYIDGGPYPGYTKGEYIDREAVERTFLERTDFMRSTGTPIYIGEFGPVFIGSPERIEERYQLLSDQLDVYNTYGASWAVWAYKDIGGQGLVYAAPDSPWLRRIAKITQKKNRLGVDKWGSLDTGVRHIMEPLEKALAEDFPDFSPFPYGTQSWLNNQIRHLLLAEPLVEDFQQCFTDIESDDTVIELAESFDFDKCLKRQRLADLLRAKAAVGLPDGVKG